jgi:hypothetical protein
VNPESEWQLREAVSAALQAALTRVRASLGGGELLPLRRKTTWAREGKSLFPTERVLESAIIAAFEALPEVEALRRVIAGDEALRRLVTESLNSSFLADPAGQLFHLRVSLLMPCLRDYLESRVNFAWEESHFEPIFQDIVKRVDGEPVPFEVIAPLHPFSSEIDHEELGEGASISRVGLASFGAHVRGTSPSVSGAVLLRRNQLTGHTRSSTGLRLSIQRNWAGTRFWTF